MNWGHCRKQVRATERHFEGYKYMTEEDLVLLMLLLHFKLLMRDRQVRNYQQRKLRMTDTFVQWNSNVAVPNEPQKQFNRHMYRPTVFKQFEEANVDQWKCQIIAQSFDVCSGERFDTFKSKKMPVHHPNNWNFFQHDFIKAYSKVSVIWLDWVSVFLWLTFCYNQTQEHASSLPGH